jgi:uncharacterized membrane protein YdjX (TVP38/TMEM64 family)
MKRSLAIRFLAVGAIVAAAAALLVLLPVKEQFQQFLDGVKGLGPWGPAVLALAYIPACILFFPGSIMTLGAGFAFGVLSGTIAVSLGSVLGVSAAFFAGRFLARGLVEKRIASRPKFRALDRAVRDEGFKIVLLTRLSPVFPFNVLNYAFGLTQVRFRDYFFASWIGMLPGTLLYVYLGATAKSVADIAAGNVEGGPWRTALLVVGLAATLVVTIVITRVARRALASAIARDQAPDAAAGPASTVTKSAVQSAVV